MVTYICAKIWNSLSKLNHRRRIQMERKRRKFKIEEQDQSNSVMDDNETPILEPDLIRAIFKQIWTRKAQEREGAEFQNMDALDSEVGAGTSKKIRPTTFANPNSLKLSCELLRIFIIEAVQRATAIAEAEGGAKIEATHLERILPQLLLDF